MLQGSLICKTMQSDLRDVVHRYEANLKEIEMLTGLRQDFLHLVENSHLDIQRGFKAYVEIREISQTRRRVKNENRSIEPLYQYLKANPNLINEIANVQGKCGNQEKLVTESKYKARVKTDIEEGINKFIVDNNTKFEDNAPDKIVKFSNHKDRIRVGKEMRLMYNKIEVNSDTGEIKCWGSKLK